MWKIEYTTPQGNFTARYINGDLLTDSPALEALVQSRLTQNRTQPYTVSATAVGPAEPLNWDKPYLAYTFVANLIGEVLAPTKFTSSGQIYWPFEREEDIPEGVVSSGSPYLELLRNRAKESAHVTTFHACGQHDCATHGNWANGKLETAGMEDWPADFKQKVISHVQALQQKYGVRVSLDARPSSTREEDGRTVIDVYNLAEENEALAAVDQEDTTIYLHPQFANGGWRARQLQATPGLARNVQDILTHEYAHALQGAIEQHGDDERLDRLKAPFLQVLDTDDESDFDQLAKDVSFYATQTVDEAIAESFLQHHRGQKKTQWSEHVGSILRKEG